MKKHSKKRYINYTKKENEMKNISYKIPNIHCNHCAHTIKMELSELKGVESVQVDVNEKEIKVAYKQPASEQKIRDLLIVVSNI